jgi:hypothetical protein
VNARLVLLEGRFDALIAALGEAVVSAAHAAEAAPPAGRDGWPEESG